MIDEMDARLSKVEGDVEELRRWLSMHATDEERRDFEQSFHQSDVILRRLSRRFAAQPVGIVEESGSCGVGGNLVLRAENAARVIDVLLSVADRVRVDVFQASEDGAIRHDAAAWIAQSYWDVLLPLFRAHPDLEPEEHKAERRDLADQGPSPATR